LAPKNAIYPYNLANVYAQFGRHADALRSYNKSLALSPNYPEALCNRGHALRELGRFAEALASMRKGHEEGKKRTNWGYDSATWVAHLERLVEAEKRLPALLAGVPARAEERILAAEACRLLGRHLDRARLFQRVLIDAPGSVGRATAAMAALKASEEKKLAPETQGRWRGQAHAWLRRDVETLSGLAASPDKGKAAAAREALLRLLRAGEFEAVRAEEALKRLPVPEREAWRRLWQAARDAVKPVALGPVVRR
jgi:tetratricopeptide (TPR) repeat protein